MKVSSSVRFIRWAAVAVFCALLPASAVLAQARADSVTRVNLPVGRSYPLSTGSPITKVSVASPDIADVVVVSQRELVINAKAAGETDAILWLLDGGRRHLRVAVGSPSDRQQIAVYIKFAEVRRDLLRTIGVSSVYSGNNARVGTGTFRTDAPFNSDGSVNVPSSAGFLTVLTDLNTKRLLALLDAEEQNGRSRTLAEPDLMAGNREEATFLAGGELPVPVVQGGGGVDPNTSRVTIQYKEFGIRLRFVGEILSDSLIKLALQPEVSSLDFANSVRLSGFLIPAIRTRRMSTTVDVRRNESLIISGLFSNTQERVRSGVPYLQNIPILGLLFSSTRWQRNQSELVVVVTPVVIDPLRARAQDVLQLVPDTALPAREAIRDRLAPRVMPPAVRVSP